VHHIVPCVLHVRVRPFRVQLSGRRRRDRSRQRKAGSGEGGDCLLRGSIGFHSAGLIEAVRGGDEGGVSLPATVNGGKDGVALSRHRSALAGDPLGAPAGLLHGCDLSRVDKVSHRHLRPSLVLAARQGYEASGRIWSE
jgi:hypothetical protein